MKRLMQISLDSFKGQTREHELHPLTLITGPNGAGKSAVLQAVRYAMGGTPGDGKTLDAIAEFFHPEKGGSCILLDTHTRSVIRGVVISDKGERSEMLHVVGVESKKLRDHQDAAAKDWAASTVTLDFGSFLALSPDKRREYVLELCGSGEEANREGLVTEVGQQLARDLLGPAAGIDSLAHHKLEPMNLEETLEATAAQWVDIVKDTLDGALAAERGSVSACAAALAKVAREERLGAGRSAKQAKAAVAEMGAPVELEVSVGDTKAAFDTAQEAVTVARETDARVGEAERAVEQARDGARMAEDNRQTAHLKLKQLEDPGEEPVEPTRPEGLTEALQDLEAKRGELTQMLSATDQLQAAMKDADLALAEALRDRKTLEKLKQGDEVKILGLCDWAEEKGTTAEAAQLISSVREYLKDHRARLENLEIELEGRKLADQVLAAATAEHDGKLVEIDALRKETVAASVKAQALSEVWDSEAQAYAIARERWRGHALAYKTAQANSEQATRTDERATAALTAARAHLGAVGSADGGTPAEATERLNEARLAYNQAENAEAKGEQYRVAKAKAEMGAIDEAAWKATEAAIKAVREVLVSDAAGPLRAVADEVLAAAGRPERVVLELENEKGKPIFRLGWRDGDTVTALEALSGGESVLLCAALAAALTAQSDGRRVLLIEAAELDIGNLDALMNGLTATKDRIGNVLVAAVVRGVPIPEGWAVIHLGPELKVEFGSPWQDPKEAAEGIREVIEEAGT